MGSRKWHPAYKRGSLKSLTRPARIFLYHASGGKIWAIDGRQPHTLMLTTTGRLTGKARTTPVMYVHKNNEYLIAASDGGSNQNPTWVSNINSKPEAIIEVNGKTINVKAVITSGDERDKLYENIQSLGIR